jgi:trimethylamine---corrinoid protein Co-methyltransferase
MFLNTMPRYDILAESALEHVDRTWRHLVSNVGVDFLEPAACEVFARAGQRVEGGRVYLDPDYLLDRAGQAPSSFVLRGRNPERDVVIGAETMTVASVGGPPFVGLGADRRDSQLGDAADFIRLSQSFEQIACVGRPLEAVELPMETRHLDMLETLMSLSDKPYIGAGGWRTRAEDAIAMARIAHSSAASDGGAPIILEGINPNSPLRFDDRMLGALMAFAEAGQAVLISPWLLLGATSPVTIAAGLAQAVAESLAGIALVQEIRPGCPVVFGIFISNTDLRTGAPALGTPETMVATLAAGQVARRFGLPIRIGGDGHTTSQLPDAQAGYEAMMSVLPTFLAGGNLLIDTVGWLEAGLVASLEKFVIDVELIRMLEATFRPLEISDDTLAVGAFEEVGPGGHFFGCEHTLERFRTCFYMPLLSSRDNFDRWTRKGRPDTAQRALEIARQTLEEFEPPRLADPVADELREYTTRRRAEIVSSGEIAY